MKRIISKATSLLTLLLLLSLTSCVSQLEDKISIESCDQIELMGFSGVKATIGFKNLSARKINLQDVNITLKESGDQIVTLTLKGEITIPRRTELYEVSTLWKFNDLNLLSALSASKRILSGKQEAFRVDVIANAKVGLFRHDIELSNMLLSEIMKSIDIETQN